MKRLALSCALVCLSTAAHAAAERPSQAAYEMCDEQAQIIYQTYALYRFGKTEEEAYSQQAAPSASAESKAWVRNVVRQIYANPASIYVNAVQASSRYEEECVKAPRKYARDQRLLE